MGVCVFCRRCLGVGAGFLGVGAAGYNQPAQDANLKHRKRPQLQPLCFGTMVSVQVVICTIGRVPAGDGHTLIYTIGRVANFIAVYIHIFEGRVPRGDGHT